MASIILGEVPAKLLSPTECDFMTDRLNHVYGFICIIIFTIIIGIQEFVGDPIHCWCPAQFTDSHCNYTEAYCWVQNTYFVSFDEPIEWQAEERYEKPIVYYQWVPFILLFLAVCLKIPYVLWKTLSCVSGISIQKTVRAAQESVHFTTDRKQRILVLAKYMDQWLKVTGRASQTRGHKFFETLSSFMCFCVGKRSVSYITGLYIFIKFLYLVVTVGLIFVLGHMLGVDYLIYGWEVVDNLVQGKEIEESPSFPRITLCDFQIRQLQNIQTYTVQCVLSVNLFNEKIFIFVWFLLVALSLSNLWSWLVAMKNFSIPSSRRSWLQKRLTITTRNRRLDDISVQKFAKFLCCDGILLLSIIENNISKTVVYDVLGEMYRLCLDRYVT